MHSEWWLGYDLSLEVCEPNNRQFKSIDIHESKYFLWIQQQQQWSERQNFLIWHLLTVYNSILDLTPEQQKMVIELRRRKQELLLEIQVSEAKSR